MSDRQIKITLLPLDRVLHVPAGTPLQDVLFEQGLEFPCGGKGSCKKCRVKVLAGELPPLPQERHVLGESLVDAGWRLACLARAENDVTLELGAWDPHILSDETSVEVLPREGLGVAIDLGTTTLVAQLLDRTNGRVLAVRTALNPQARHGADIMSRVNYALQPGGGAELTGLIRERLGAMILQLLKLAATGAGHVAETTTDADESEDGHAVDAAHVREVVLTGNTVMHHLFCGFDLEPLSHTPFESLTAGEQDFSAEQLGWHFLPRAHVRFLPSLGSFVGSDILAGILATRMHTSERVHVLIDLGTNGEMVVGNRTGLLCASTAAGPAFEGAKITMGMRAETGAINRVATNGNGLHCSVIGNRLPPRGLCGSGLVDAVAVGLETDQIGFNGRLRSGTELPLLEPVALFQCDIRELQLAKGAIAAGVELLLKTFGAEPADVERVYLCGAFGNYIQAANAIRIGLLNFPLEKIHAAGNTSLLGAKLALLTELGDAATMRQILNLTRHLSLNEDERFLDIYVDHMQFPKP